MSKHGSGKISIAIDTWKKKLKQKQNYRNLFVLGVELFRNISLPVHGDRINNKTNNNEKGKGLTEASERGRWRSKVNSVFLQPLSDSSSLINMRPKKKKGKSDPNADTLLDFLLFALSL